MERDPLWIHRLGKRFSVHDSVEVPEGDALHARLPKEPFRVVANIPFNASTAILERLLDDPSGPLQSVHVLVQEQFARENTLANLRPR